MGSKLYVSTDEDFHYSILIYDLKDFGNGSPKPKVSVMVPEASTPYVSRIVDSHRHDSGYAYGCLAKHESLEQLFLIYIMCNVIYKPEHVDSWNPEFVTSPKITAVEVFKLDMNKEPLQWIKCQSLDDNVIFVSGITNMVISRAALSSTDQELIRENSVYFAISFQCPSDPWQGVRLGVKHLTDSSIKYFSVEKSNHSDVPYPFWFVPSI
ncbi:uncharacterized protein LOC130712684 [Lotus japonicus]|uniref:uncharacterized protein LOC130712684 n=1 Tax=Lotus japonicus TaxID=34305 RepID=UPI00258C304E|nr:uncharacterized protein LOC130712684 [Lotus japonicus]